ESIRDIVAIECEDYDPALEEQSAEPELISPEAPKVIAKTDKNFGTSAITIIVGLALIFFVQPSGKSFFFFTEYSEFDGLLLFAGILITLYGLANIVSLLQKR
ncbi:MAG: hypothetical protein Q7K42_01990, partial [Candidatus Diapherotrites archaeon]|nr:hypothetical protein [Candidatus Diapherotrites archaeon]